MILFKSKSSVYYFRNSENMKSFIIFTVVLAALKTVQGGNPFNHKDPEIVKHIDRCGTETGADISIFKEDKIDKEKLMELYKDHTFRCLKLCIMKGVGLMNKDGEYNMDTIKAKLELKDEDMEHVKECIEKNKQEDECDRAFEVKKCVMKIVKKHG